MYHYLTVDHCDMCPWNQGICPIHNDIYIYADIIQLMTDVIETNQVCKICHQNKSIDNGYTYKYRRNTFICYNCYKIWHKNIFKIDNDCLICNVSNIENIFFHMYSEHHIKLKSDKCKYCNCNNFMIIDTKDYYYKHYCTIPIKNKYMNINIR